MKLLKYLLLITFVSIVIFFFTKEKSMQYLALNPFSAKIQKGCVENKNMFDDKAGTVGYKYIVILKEKDKVFKLNTYKSINLPQYEIGDSVRVAYNKYNPNQSIVLNLDELITFLLLFGIPNMIAIALFKKYLLKEKEVTS